MIYGYENEPTTNNLDDRSIYSATIRILRVVKNNSSLEWFLTNPLRHGPLSAF